MPHARTPSLHATRPPSNTSPPQVCDKHGCLLIMDASLLSDNLHFIKQREAACAGMSIREITRAMADQ